MSSKPEQFIQDLVQFYRNKGIHNVNPSQFVARLNGKTVNLSELYSLVLEFGGSYKVNQLNLWDEVFFKLFKTKYIGSNFAVALRQIYNRYLLQYEKSCSGNFTAEQWNEDEDDENLFSNANSHSHSNSLITPAQHFNNVTDTSGSTHNDTKLYCSLLSGLPNELNFAFNVTTILSNCNRFDWTNDYKLINVLLDSMKSYCCVCDQFDEDVSFGKTVFTEEDEVERLKSYFRSSIKKSENNPVQNGVMQTKQNNSTSNEEFVLPCKDKIEFVERRCNCYSNYWHQVCCDEDTLSLVFLDDAYIDIDFNLPYVLKDLPLNLMKKNEKRIELIADIIRNISFTYDQNSTNRVSMIPLIKFLVLLLRSEKVTFLNLSLEILSNIAPSFSFSSNKPQPEVFYYLLDILLKNIVTFAMTSNNIYCTTKAFEIMARFISCHNNDANLFLESHFDNLKLYERITHLLTCQYDITLLLALLEFCFVLSEVRPFLLVNPENRTLLKLLVSFLNCDAASHFTTGALKKIKFIDERPRYEIASSNVSNQNVRSHVSSSAVITKQVPTTNVAQNMLDNESFAINWLKSTYDEVPSNNSLKVNDIYAEYVKYCCRNSRRNVIASQSFNYLLKRCFTSINFGSNQTVENLSLKHSHDNRPNNPTMQPAPLQLMSPILKAHLSTPPKNNAIPATPFAKNESNTTSVATTTTNTSTLIKSLLANKLRSNQIISTSSNLNNINKPTISTVNSQPLLNTSSVVIQNDTIKSDLNVPQTQNIIFANNPTTSFALTPTLNFSNNFIVSNSNIQQPQSQQILLVRTIIAAPGQQNPSTPVRLLVPASMITQQRLSAPTHNGLNATSISNNQNAIVSSIATQASVLQTKLGVSQANQINNIISNSPLVTTPQQIAPIRNQISNSSPLLNVLLDKGKIPDFPAQSLVNQQATVSNSIATANNSITTIQAPILQQNPQPKMYILTTSPVKQPSVNSQNSETSSTISNPSTNLTFIANTNESKPTAPLILTSPVNGDLKTIVTSTNQTSSIITNSTNNNNALIKHALDNSLVLDNNKKLKTSQTSIEQKSNSNSIDHSSENSIGSSNEITVNNSLVNNIPPENTVTSNSSDVDSKDKSQIKIDDTISSDMTNSVEQTLIAPPPPKPELIPEYECQWDNCQMKFLKPSEVFYHVHTYHVMSPTFPSVMNCLWGGPEGKGPGCLSKRPKLSLLTHLQDFHCNLTTLKQELLRKKQLSINGTTTITLPQPPAHPGYAQNAAMLAIRRHSTNYYKVNKQKVTVFTPLTVSIRLTSALILRNLAKRSHFIKKSLKIFESELCEISICDDRDESRTIAQCLAILNESK